MTTKNLSRLWLRDCENMNVRNFLASNGRAQPGNIFDPTFVQDALGVLPEAVGHRDAAEVFDNHTEQWHLAVSTTHERNESSLYVRTCVDG